MQNRREFMKTSGVFAAMMAAAPTIVVGEGTPRVFKVGMIGAGGRCKGAFDNLRKAAATLGHAVELVAVCDFFEDRARGASKQFSDEKAKVFSGANGYKEVVAIPEIEIIVTATPPAFRPIHVEASIKAGKHVFAEKPVAVDGPGVRQFIAAAKLAQEKKLSLVAGTQRRHQRGYNLQAKALQEGKLGPILGGNIYWNGSVPWVHARRPDSTNAAYLADNWLNFSELSGDHIVEQHVHNIDIANWFLGRYPKTALGFGGRARRVSGNQYDFFSIDFDYGDGVHIHSMCRQISGTSNNVSEHFRTPEYDISGGGKVQKIGEQAALALEGDFRDGNPYEVEHIHLLEGIMSGNVVNEGETVAMSTACAIAGRLSAYTGQTIRLSELVDEKFKDSPIYNFACKPSWADFEADGDVAMPELGDDKFPLPGKPWNK